MFTRFLKSLPKLILTSYFSLLFFLQQPIIAQENIADIVDFNFPVKFESFGWRDLNVLGVDIKHKGISLVSINMDQPFEIDRNEPIEISMSYTVIDFPYNSRSVSLVFSGVHGDFSEIIVIYSNKNSLSNDQIGGANIINAKLNVPAHIPAGKYEMLLKLDSGDQKNIPGMIALSSIRVIEIDQILSKTVEILYHNLFYGWEKGHNISPVPLYGPSMLLNWSGAECIGYINNKVPQNLQLVITARRAGIGRGVPVFDFFLDGVQIQQYKVEEREWSEYNIPLFLKSGEHEFAIRFLNGGGNRSLIIQKVAVELQKNE